MIPRLVEKGSVLVGSHSLMPERRYLVKGDLRIMLSGVRHLESEHASTQTVHRDCLPEPEFPLGIVIIYTSICLSYQ